MKPSFDNFFKWTASNCLVCAYHTFIDPFRLFYPLKGYCQHSSLYHSTKPQFKIWKFSQTLLIIVSFFLVLPTLILFRYLPPLWQTERSLCLILISDQVLVISTVILVLIIRLRLSFQRLEAEGYLKIFEHRKHFLLDDILAERELKWMVLTRNLLIVVILIGAGLNAYLHYSVSYDNLPWSMVRRFTIVYCCALQCYIAAEFMQKIFIIGKVLQAVMTSVKSTLNVRLFLNTVSSQKVVLKSAFARYSHLVLCLNENLNLLMKFMTSCLVTWILLLTLSLILNFYIFCEYVDYNFGALCALQYRTMAIIFGISGLLLSHDCQLKQKVSGTILNTRISLRIST